MATAGQPQAITSEKIELLSFLRQNIVRKLCEEAAHRGDFGLTPRSCKWWSGTSTWGKPPTKCLIGWCGESLIRSEVSVVVLLHVTPQRPLKEYFSLWFCFARF